MSGSMRDLRRRIRALTSTEQLTRAMRTVASSKYNRVQQRSRRFYPYSQAAFRLLQAVGAQEEAPRAMERVSYVCFTANRGLCGAYNADLMRYLAELLQQEEREYSVYLCGRWGVENAALYEVDHVQRDFPAHDIPEYAQARDMADFLWELWSSGVTDEVIFVYQKSRSILSQTPVSERFLPLTTEGEPAGGEYIFSPERERLLPALRSQCLSARAYGVMLMAAEGAQGAMMNAMRQASDNAQEMLGELKLELNRMRQQAITTEMLELASGKNANKDSEDSDE